ncbi:MAG: hypothetical protein ACTIJ9_08100 [Aequorivita sp.]
MSHSEKLIIETYSKLFDGFNAVTKIGLIERLTKSLKKDESKKERDFYKSYGAFGSDKSPEEIINSIKFNRKFTNKEFKL